MGFRSFGDWTTLDTARYKHMHETLCYVWFDGAWNQGTWAAFGNALISRVWPDTANKTTPWAYPFLTREEHAHKVYSDWHNEYVGVRCTAADGASVHGGPSLGSRCAHHVADRSTFIPPFSDVHSCSCSQLFMLTAVHVHSCSCSLPTCLSSLPMCLAWFWVWGRTRARTHAHTRANTHSRMHGKRARAHPPSLATK